MEIRSMTSFIAYWEGIRERTSRVVQLIPDDRYDWRAGAGRYSFGELVRHLAAFERYVFAENAAGRTSHVPERWPDNAADAVAVRSYFRAMHEEALEILRGLSDEDLQRRCTTPAGVPITTWKWLRAMVEHEVHHRGQLYLMLGLIGVATPPMFGLTAEQVMANSLPRGTA